MPRKTADDRLRKQFTHHGVWAPQKLLYTVEEVAELVSLSRAQIYRLIDLQELAAVKIGKCRRISAAQLDRFVRRLEQSSGFTEF